MVLRIAFSHTSQNYYMVIFANLPVNAINKKQIILEILSSKCISENLDLCTH